MHDATHNLKDHQIDQRPWGMFEQFTLNTSSTVKLIDVKEGEALSLQTHEHREEFWRIVAGHGTVTIGDETFGATVGDSFYIPIGAAHRMAGKAGGVTFVEIAFGAFDEGDIHRLDDQYGRV